MKWRKRIVSAVLASTLAFSSAAFAADDSDAALHDARTEGYKTNPQVEGSTSLMWIGFIFFSIICMSVLFKDSKRARTE